MTQTKDSPLAEAEPESLQILFSMDPLELTDEDVDKIAQVLWSQQEKWAIKEEVKQKEGKKPRVLKKALDDESLKNVLASLGLDKKQP